MRPTYGLSTNFACRVLCVCSSFVVNRYLFKVNNWIEVARNHEFGYVESSNMSKGNRHSRVANNQEYVSYYLRCPSRIKVLKLIKLVSTIRYLVLVAIVYLCVDAVILWKPWKCYVRLLSLENDRGWIAIAGALVLLFVGVQRAAPMLRIATMQRAGPVLNQWPASAEPIPLFLYCWRSNLGSMEILELLVMLVTPLADLDIIF
jgi:hypothetical protein